MMAQAFPRRPRRRTTHAPRALAAAALMLASLALAPPPALAAPPLALPPLATQTPETGRGGYVQPVYVLDPIVPSGLSVHINMPSIRGEPDGWLRLRAAVRKAQQLGFALFLHNIPGPRNGGITTETFDTWPHHDLLKFINIIAGSRVPLLLYVGPVEQPGDAIAAPPERLVRWRDDLVMLQQITGARTGIVIDASAVYTPDSAPAGMTRFHWFSLFAEMMSTLNIEVGFEAFRRDFNNVPYEDRRHYALLQYIATRYSTLPSSADFDARIMSAVDALPPAENPRRNTIWLHNTTWDELADGDPVPAEWLDAWGVTPDGLQPAVVNRLYAKGYALVLPLEVIE